MAPFLENGLVLANQEPAAPIWFACKFGQPQWAASNAHLTGGRTSADDEGTRAFGSTAADRTGRWARREDLGLSLTDGDSQFAVNQEEKVPSRSRTRCREPTARNQHPIGAFSLELGFSKFRPRHVCDSTQTEQGSGIL
jgi:hypothetical protein